MPVCHIISSFRPVIGGAERATETLVHALRASEAIDVIVLTRRYSTADPAIERIRGVPVYRLGRPGRGKLNALTFAMQAFAFLAFRLGSYRILHVQNIDTPVLLGMVAKIVLRRRLVATIHGETQIIGRNSSWLGRRRLDLMARLVDIVTSINTANTHALIEAGVPPDRIREIPNGIEPDVFRPATASERDEARAALGLAADAFVGVYIGRLQPYKRVDLVIEAWAGLDVKVAPATLLVVGDGPEAPRLASSVVSLGERVRLEGPTDVPAVYLRAADVFVNASGDPEQAWSEGLSVALLEAMSVGVLPIVTKGPGNDQLVVDGETGLSFPVGDAAALRDCLQQAMDDQELRTRLSRQARARVDQTYSALAVAAQIGEIYREVAVP